MKQKKMGMQGKEELSFNLIEKKVCLLNGCCGCIRMKR